MNKILLLFLTVVTFASCGETFKIKGTSSISPVEGQKLYLKVIEDNDVKTIDSCEMIHGCFSFKGSIDTTKLAGIFTGDEQRMVFILDNADINIDINQNGITVNGTALNDTLNNFFKEMSVYSYKAEELNSKRNTAIMDGEDLDVVNKSLVEELMKLNNEQTEKVTSFIKKNYDNILGPTVFKMVISKQYAAPILDNWIEEIMIEATEKFKNDTFVKEFYAQAKENQEILNGMRTPSSEQPGKDQYSNP